MCQSADPCLRRRLLQGQDGLHHRRHRIHGQGAAGEDAPLLFRRQEDLPLDQTQKRAGCAGEVAAALKLAGNT